MPSGRRRILELALESLNLRKKQIDEAIAEVTAELRRTGATKSLRGAGVGALHKRSRFTKEERARRSARMKAYWEKRRQEKARQG